MAVDIEEIESTKSEKFLAVVLAAFLLMGSTWIYVKLDAWVPGGPNYTMSAEERRAAQTQEAAYKEAESTTVTVDRRRSELTIAKDKFDIAAAKGGSTGAEEASYERAETNLRLAEKQQAAAQARVARAEQQLRAFEQARADTDHGGHAWAVAGSRLAFIAGWLMGSFGILSRLRERRSRFLPLGFAAIGAGVITAVIYTVDYITEFIDPLELGPIVLSGIGTLATMGAFVGLQEWLERRLPGKRVRSSECPYCGHPVRGMADGTPAPFCEGCGHAVTEPCAACGSTRRVGAAHCPACGSP